MGMLSRAASTEWKNKQQSAFRQKNPLLHWRWGGKGEKAAGWSFMEPKQTNRGINPIVLWAVILLTTSSSHPRPVTNTGTVWNRTKHVAKEVTRQILLKTTRTSSDAGTESFYGIQKATGRLNHAITEDRNSGHWMFSTLSTSSKAKEKTLPSYLRKSFLDYIPLKNLLMTFPGFAWYKLLELRRSEAKTNCRFQRVWRGKEHFLHLISQPTRLHLHQLLGFGSRETLTDLNRQELKFFLKLQHPAFKFF